MKVIPSFEFGQTPRVHWQCVLNMVVKFRFSQKAEEFYDYLEDCQFLEK
jgi:hypothetical protein